MNICVLIPTCYRPDGLKRALSSLKRTAPSVAISIAAEADDFQALKLAQQYNAHFSICKEPMSGAPKAWNTALEGAQDYDAYFTGSDDVEFADGWLEYVLEELDRIGGEGLVGINDDFKNAVKRGYSTHYLMTRKFIIEHHGGVIAIPHYKADFTDVEACKRAQAAGMYGYADKAVVKHIWGGNAKVLDRCYSNAKTFRTNAHAIYQRRKQDNFPDDFEPILKG